MTISLRKKSFNAQHREHANGGLASTSPSKKLTLKTRSESFTVDGLTQTSDDGEIRKMLHYSTNEEIVLTLIERVFQQCTLLHCAVLFGHAKMAEWLIDHGANLDARDVDLCTPLHYAALGGFTDIVDLLLKRGADANARNHFGETPLCSLHVAARKSARHIDTPLARGDSIVMKIWINRNMKEVVRLLGVHKADFNIPNRRGATPLHLFASKEKRDDVEVVELLLQFGANANNKDLDGRLPIQYAVCDGMKELLKKNTDSCTIC